METENAHITYYRAIVDPCNNAVTIAHNNDDREMMNGMILHVSSVWFSLKIVEWIHCPMNLVL